MTFAGQQEADSGVTAPEHPFLGFKHGEGKDAVILPLVLNMECTATESEMNGNVAATLARGYQPFTSVLDSVSGSVALCGAGPSLADHIGELKGDVFAVNSAIKAVLDAGIVPRFAMIWDCAEICAEFAIPHPEVTYLIGSRCHPKVFERLCDCRIVVWHADGDHNILKFLEDKNVNEPLVKGGTTGVTRGLYVAYALGYRDFHLYGADSSYREGKSHINGSLVHEHLLKVMVNGRWFDSTAQWAAQIEEMKVIYPMFKHTALRAEMTAYDDGMLGWVMSIMKADESKALANALATIELQLKAKGAPMPGVPGVLPEGSIRALAEEHPESAAAQAMKTLQPVVQPQAHSTT